MKQSFKTQISEHGYNRLRERLEKMTIHGDITAIEAFQMEYILNQILKRGFNPNKSYGIKLGTFSINPNSFLVTRKHPSGVYYEIYSADPNDIIKDSTGNEFWVIIRNNKLITSFLRKSIQRSTASKPRNAGGLGVDIIIDDFNRYL